MSPHSSPSPRVLLLQNVMAGLTVSFVAVSLGAAFGLLSGRGAFAGMISAAIIPIVVSALGGTRVQTSGPTGPMTAVTAVFVAFAYDGLGQRYPDVNPDHFITLVVLLGGAILVLGAILQLGRFISLVPNVVISGFMNGIALIIWFDVSKKLFGLAGKQAMGGPVATNVLVCVATTVLCFTIPKLTRRYVPRFASLLSGTLLAIVIVTVAAAFLAPGVERISLSAKLDSFGALAELVRSQIPTTATWGLVLLALPYSLQLAMLAYLDTLLTALVMDRLTGEKTQKNREIGAQGLSFFAVAALGGIAGAQATIRSVLIFKEGATMRVAGVLVGVFALIEILLFQDLLSMIPQAVFAGVLIKVGWDVLDHASAAAYIRQLRTHERDPKLLGLSVSHGEMAMIVGTTLVTAFFNLNAAVVAFSILFWVLNKTVLRDRPMADLKQPEPPKSSSAEGEGDLAADATRPASA